MNILILSCKTGQGHNSVANAIAETLEMQGHSWQMIDALSFISNRTAKIMSWGHSFIYCHCPEVFQAGYEVAERYPKTLSEGSVAYWLFARGSRDLNEYCKEQKFDAIICTHVFAALMVTDMKRSYQFSTKSFFVATDYTCYPGVQESEMDAYFIPDDSLISAYKDKHTITSGIPVYQRFFSETDKAEAKQSLGIRPEQKHILVMCGSMGCGPMEEIAKRIATNMTSECILSIVCGTNQRLYQKLSEAYAGNANVKIHGFVQNVPLMMEGADIYVTKPGGISTSEAMTKGLPMVLVDAVAGCEDYNLRYFCDMGGAVAAKDPERIAELCLKLVSDADRRSTMTEQLQKAKKNGAQIICDYLQAQMD